MTINCPLCQQTATVSSGRVLPHSYTIRGWAYDASSKQVMADLVVTCAPKIRVVRV